MSKSKQASTPNWANKTIRFLWLAFAAGVVGFIVFIWMVSVNFLGLFGPLPDFKALENPDTEVASQLFSSDGVLLGTYYRQNRSPVTYDELSPNLVNALISTEDERFEEHSGIDLKAMIRVLSNQSSSDRAQEVDPH